ncbi:MAG: NAD-dependent deacylase [Chloroflexota bacterium]
MKDENVEQLDQLRETLQKAKSVVALTGAGVSAESGVPTFREAQTGLWARYQPEKLATSDAFLEDPPLVWEWYAWRRELVSSAEPNPAHRALVALENYYPNFALITQNVDGLHAEAGSRNIIELHGNISRVKCFNAHHPVENWDALEGSPPHCPLCGSLLRPDVVWFGEMLPEQALISALGAMQDCEVYFSIGTSALVHPAAALTVEAIKDLDVTVVEINPAETPITPYVDFALNGSAGQILPELVDLLVL